MKKIICIIILVIISIVIIALNIYCYKDYKIFTNRIASFNNDQYLLLYSEINPYIETEVNNEKLIGEYSFYFKKNDSMKKEDYSPLIDFVKKYKEIGRNKLYIIGVDYKKSKPYYYEYFILDYKTDKLIKYENVDDMPEKYKNVFENEKGWIYPKV